MFELVSHASQDSSARPLRVALAGNPNCGKTSLFNALTGARHHVANYPGVTVEKRSGWCDVDGVRMEVVDLPGTYSLSALSPEERVAEEELGRRPDVVVVVADSMQLQRSLVIMAQVAQSGANPVLCLNMADEARAAGQRLDVAQMERLLGFPVVETVGHRGDGLQLLKAAIQRAARTPVARHKVVLGEDLEGALTVLRPALEALGDRSPDWTALRLLQGDQGHTERVLALPGGPAVVEEARRQRARVEAASGTDMAVFVAQRTFGFVDGLLREVRTAPPRVDSRELSDRLDTFLAHPLLGLPVFAVVMYGIFWLTFSLGEYPMGWIESGVHGLAALLSSLWPDGSESVLRSLLVDGVVGGVGGVVVFLPNILLLFLGLSFLEDTGYMARAAFLTDQLMHRFGLHGKSFIPMLSGFGCTVPGIMATRTLENERDRLVTMLVLPLMSCGARLPIWLLLVPAFFPPAWRAPVLWSIYAAGVALALGLALLLRRTILRGDDAPFVMELPPYRLPTPRAVLVKVLERGGIYLRKAGTIILAISILLWAAMSFPKPDAHAVEQVVAAAQASGLSPQEVEARRAALALRHSVAGRVGTTLEPVFEPLGFDWRIVTAMIGAFAAKEVFVAQMGIVYSLTGNPDETLGTQLARDYPPWTGLALVVFLLVAAPCMATVAVTRRESGKWKWALLQFGALTVVGYLLALVVNQVGRFLA